MIEKKRCKLATLQIIFEYTVLFVNIVYFSLDLVILNDKTLYKKEMTSSLPNLDFFVVGLLCITVIIFEVLDLIYLEKKCKERVLDELIDGLVKLRFGLIPFNLVVFAAHIGVSCYLLWLHPIMLVFVIIIFLAYFFIIGSSNIVISLFGINFIKLYNMRYEEEKIGKIHCVFQCLPILDILSSIILLKRYKKLTENEGKIIC